MVVADQGNWVADVVIVVEGTANLSPYVESLKTNYILPTLEYFNGGPPDDRDCGYDSNSTTYALVVFMAADCAPEPAAVCNAPTTSISKVLSWFDKVSFIGGAGESCSHIAEGLSTALQVFDDFQSLRDSVREQGVVAQKHCILVCNSPPYPLPALESAMYSGQTVDQLATIMSEKQVNFSILSPRKIPALYKLYEKAGGDLQMALCKNYAKDRRHLVLLRGYQLQERPISPPATTDTKSGVASPPPALQQNPRSPVGTGQKRPSGGSPTNPRDSKVFKQPNNQSGTISTMATPQASPQSGQVPVTFPPQGTRLGVPTPPTSHLSTINQPNPPNVSLRPITDSHRPSQNQSPVPIGTHMPWNQPAAPSPPVSTPPPTNMPVLTSKLSSAPGTGAIRHPAPGVPTSVSLTSLVSGSQGQPEYTSFAGFRPGVPQIPLRMGGSQQQVTTQTTASLSGIGNPSTLAVQLSQMPSFSQPQSQPSQPTQPTTIQPSLGMGGMQGKMGNGSPNAPFATPQVPGGVSLPVSSSVSGHGMNPNMQSQQQQPGVKAPVKERRAIWQGILEYQDKPVAPAGNPPSRNICSLPCSISSYVINGETEISAEKWPSKIMLQLMPKSLLTTVMPVVKNAARCVMIMFNQDSEDLQKLNRIMNHWSGFIHFSPSCDIKIMIVLYMPDKNVYMGLIANDQEALVATMKALIETHRKQQNKQKMMPPHQTLQIQQTNQIYQLQQMSGGTMATAGGMGLPVSTSVSNPGIGMNQLITEQSNPVTMGGNSGQLGPRLPAVQQQQQQAQPPTQQPQHPSGGQMVQNNPPQTAAQQQQQATRLSLLEAERQQNLMKIQQLQQTLEAAQQKELQYKAAQEQTQALLERQRQLHQQQKFLTGSNPQLRHLLQQVRQQVAAQQQMRQQQQQLLIQQSQQQQQQQQQPSGIRTSVAPGGLMASLGGQSQGPPSQAQQQQSQGQQNSGWDETTALLDLLGGHNN